MKPPIFDPLTAARAALLDHLPKDRILARYQAAAGGELASGKFASPESSAALVANAFGLFVDHPELLVIPATPVAQGEGTRVELEMEVRFPWHGGRHPWLDVVIETDTALIGIESKRYEPFRAMKAATFSAAYSRPVWGEAMAPFETMRDALSGGRTFRFLDAGQLVKHAFGLRTQAHLRGKRAWLCYLYAEPGAFPAGRTISAAEHAGHREEVATLAAELAAIPAEVAFHSLSYRALLDAWAGTSGLADHARALEARFDV